MTPGLHRTSLQSLQVNWIYQSDERSKDSNQWPWLRTWFIGGTYHVKGLRKDYVSEYPHNIWPKKMVQSIHFRILKFPLIKKGPSFPGLLSYFDVLSLLLNMGSPSHVICRYCSHPKLISSGWGQIPTESLNLTQNTMHRGILHAAGTSFPTHLKSGAQKKHLCIYLLSWLTVELVGSHIYWHLISLSQGYNWPSAWTVHLPPFDVKLLREVMFPPTNPCLLIMIGILRSRHILFGTIKIYILSNLKIPVLTAVYSTWYSQPSEANGNKRKQ